MMASDNLTINRLVPGLIEQIQNKPEQKITSAGADDSSFKDLFANMINSVNDLQKNSDEIQQAFLAGEPVELHEVMIKAEEAGVAMDMLLEIRNKLTSAFSEMMRMSM